MKATGIIEKKKTLLEIYSTTRAAIAFICRTLHLPKHVVTEASLAAVKVIHAHRKTLE